MNTDSATHKAPVRSRRRAIAACSVLLATALSGSFPGTSVAASYPEKPIRIIVPFPAGGGSDVVARIVGARLAERVGQAVVVENVSGASSMLGAGRVANAAPDGYTLLMATNTTLSTNPALQPRMPYDAATSFAPISQVIRTPLILISNPKSDITSVPRLIELARQRPGGMNYASFGAATTGNIGGELFKRATNTDMVHVPYKGSAPAIADLVAGHVPVLFDTGATALAQIKAGRALPLAVLQPRRSPLAPDVPAMSEFGYSGIDITVWFGLLAPAATPAAIVQRLSSEIAQIVQEPAIREKLLAQNVEPVGSTPADFAEFLKADRASMTKIIKDAGITID